MVGNITTKNNAHKFPRIKNMQKPHIVKGTLVKPYSEYAEAIVLKNGLTTYVHNRDLCVVLERTGPFRAKAYHQRTKRKVLIDVNQFEAIP